MLGQEFAAFCRQKLRSLLARIRREVREPLAGDWTALVLESTAGARIAA